MRNAVYVAVAVLALLSAACSSGDIDCRLQQAEDLMSERPDSSFSILSQIPADSIGSVGQRARYALLMAMAQDKNYIEETNDSLINIAVRYYDSGNDARRRMLAHYYRAVILFNGKDYRAAIVELMKSEAMAREISDDLYCAMSNDMIADTYYVSYNMSRANEYRRKAIDGYQKVGRTLNVLYDQVDMARAYSTAFQYDEALMVLDSIEVDDVIGDSTFMGFYNEAYIHPLLSSGRTEDAMFRFAKAKTYMPLLCGLYDLTLISNLFIANNEIDSATYYLSLFERYNDNGEDEEMIQYLSYKIANKQGDYVSALSYHEKMMELYNDKIHKVLRQSVALADRDYFNDKYSLERLRSDRFRIVAICSVILLLVVSVATVLFFRLRTRRKAAEADASMLDLRLQISRQSSLIESLFDEHFSVLDNLSSEYFEKQDSPKNVRDTIVRDFEREIERIRQPESIAKIQNTVNACLDGVVDKMRRQLPWLKETDVVFLSLIFAGLSARTVCLLTDNKLGNYYNKRSRLAQRISASDAPDKAFFLKCMKK